MKIQVIQSHLYKSLRVVQPMFIDPHVHCRDEEQSHKETIEHALRVAERAGFTAIFDMPNTARPVTTRERVEERLVIARRVNSVVQYGLYMALTADLEQVKRAVETFQDLSQVVGFKLYAGHSVIKAFCILHTFLFLSPSVLPILTPTFTLPAASPPITSYLIIQPCNSPMEFFSR